MEIDPQVIDPTQTLGKLIDICIGETNIEIGFNVIQEYQFRRAPEPLNVLSFRAMLTDSFKNEAIRAEALQLLKREPLLVHQLHFLKEDMEMFTTALMTSLTDRDIFPGIEVGRTGCRLILGRAFVGFPPGSSKFGQAAMFFRLAAENNFSRVRMIFRDFQRNQSQEGYLKTFFAELQEVKVGGIDVCLPEYFQQMVFLRNGLRVFFRVLSEKASRKRKLSE